MRFSWMGLFLAPLLVPLLFSMTLLSVGLFGPNPGDGVSSAAFLFLVLLLGGCVISYGTTICFFLPCLFLLSLWEPITYVRVCLLGLALGAAVNVPLTWQVWRSSGEDSGPPTESFLTFALSWIADLDFWLYACFAAVAGLITAALYWWLATPRRDPASLRASWGARQ